jgi:hypothetical protein
MAVHLLHSHRGRFVAARNRPHASFDPPPERELADLVATILLSEKVTDPHSLSCNLADIPPLGVRCD